MLLINNIKGLIGVTTEDRLSGEQMSQMGVIEDAFVLVEDDRIVDFGKVDNLNCDIQTNKNITIIDAQGRYVLPAFCDSHTHLVYAGSREGEFVDKVRGLSYEDIAKRGGGIINSAKKLHATSEDELFDNALERCNKIIRSGTGAVEIKSGYGLNVEDELKMLRVIRRLKESTPLTIKSTLLGAHSVPLEYRGREVDFVNLVIDEMIPRTVNEGLADFVDVFCDHGFFTVPQTAAILQAAAKYGLQGKIHANELAVSGGVQVGVEHSCLSVDHLERMDAAAIEALKNTKTMATVLPGASFFLGIPFADVRAMIEAGLSVALASDFNPGSSPMGNMQFVMSLGVIRQRMLPMEALAATTINGAYAMGLNKTHGSIAVGKRANLLITKQIPSVDIMPYYYMDNHIETVILNGKIQ